MEELAALVRKAQHGDIEAFGRVVERFQRMACAVAYPIVGDLHLAEDVAQEAFLEAYQALPRLQEPAAFPAWFRRIVVKFGDRMVRGRQLPTAPLESAGALACATPGPPQLVEGRETRRLVQAAVAALAEPERTMVSLFYLGGYPQSEIAAIVDLPAPVVKKRLFRARQVLRRKLEAHMPEEFAGQLSGQSEFARTVQFFIAVRAGELETVRRLLGERPALVAEHERWDAEMARRNRMPAVRSYTALHRAAEGGDAALAELLLAAGAAVSEPTNAGITPLHLAVLNDRPALVELLLRHGADPNLATARGMTPLHWAVIRDRRAHIRQLLAAGASPDAADAEGRTPRDWAALKQIDLTSTEESAA
jgi:RNA polymerase sigma factor (sigma-70 family)